MKIDFAGIQAFVSVAELGGFRRAADELHVTQTALTRRVQHLEAYLGVKLLDRTTRSVALTAVGREFLPRARGIVAETNAAVLELKEVSRNSRGGFTLEERRRQRQAVAAADQDVTDLRGAAEVLELGLVLLAVEVLGA